MSREEVEEFFSEDFGFRLLTPKLGVPLFDQPIDFDTPAASNFPLQLLDVGHKTQVYAAANADFVGVGKLGDLDDLEEGAIRQKFTTVAVPNVTSVRFNASNEQLYILSDGTPQKAEVSEICSGSSAGAFSAISLKSDVMVLEPSPSHPESYAFLDSAKTLSITHSASTSEVPGVDAFSWTYSGAEIVVVRSSNLEILNVSGALTSTFELEEAGRIFSISSIDPNNWYLVGRPEDDDEMYIYTLVTRSGGSFSAKELLLPPPVNEVSRQPTTYFSSIREWMAGSTFAFLASGLSAEITTLECGTNTRLVFQLIDTDRAELPMDEDLGDDTLPVGFAIDLSGTYRTVKNVSPLIEEAEGVLPRILCLNSAGSLFVWNVFDVAGVREKTIDLKRAIENLPAGNASGEGAMKFAAKVPEPNSTTPSAILGPSNTSPPASQPGFGQNSASINGVFPPANTAAVGFGATGFGATSFGKSQNAGAQMFGANDFKSGSLGSSGASGASGKPAFGSGGFGQSGSGNSAGFGASGFGSLAPASTGSDSNTKSSGFGSFGSGFGAASDKPAAFGQSSFGAQKSGGFLGNAASASGAASDSSKPGFGASSKFGASTGSGGNASSPFASLAGSDAKASPFSGLQGNKSSPFSSLSGKDEKASPFSSLGGNAEKSSPFASLLKDEKSSPFSSSSGKDEKASPFASLGGNAEKSSPFASLLKDEKSSPFSSLKKDETSSPFAGLMKTEKPSPFGAPGLESSKPADKSSPFASFMKNEKPSPASFLSLGDKKLDISGATGGHRNAFLGGSSRVESYSDVESESDEESQTESEGSEESDDISDSTPENKGATFPQKLLFSSLTLGGKAPEKPKAEVAAPVAETSTPLKLGGLKLSSPATKSTREVQETPSFTALSASSTTPLGPLNASGETNGIPKIRSGVQTPKAVDKAETTMKVPQSKFANGITGNQTTTVQPATKDRKEEDLYENKDIAQVVKEIEYLKFGGFSEPREKSNDQLATRFKELLQLTDGRMEVLALNSEKSSDLIKAAGVHRKSLTDSDLEDPTAWTLGNLADLAKTTKAPRETLNDILTSLKHQDLKLSALLEGEDAAGRKKAELEKILAQLASYKQSVDSPDLTKRPLDARALIMRQQLRKKLANVENLQEEVSQKLLPLGVHLGPGDNSVAKVEKLEKLVRELSIRARVLMQEAGSLEEEVHMCCLGKPSGREEDSGVQLLLGFTQPSGVDRLKLAEKFAGGTTPRKITFKA